MVTFAPVDPSQPQWSGGTEYTGQQMLTANPGTMYNGSQLFNTYAWCVDVFDNIYLGGDSIVYNLQPLNVPNAGEIAKVAMWGDEQLAKGDADPAQYRPRYGARIQRHGLCCHRSLG